MRLLVVGLGSIGARHLRNLRAVAPEARITVWHQRARRGECGVEPETADASVFSLDEALRTDPDAAVIASPASRHLEAALPLAERGVHLLVEKPLSHNLEEVDALLRVCRERSAVLMVGYNFRFSPSLRATRAALAAGRIGRPLALRAEVGQYLPDWRPGTDYRRGVSGSSRIGGGVVLELSHELDYARWLLGEVESVAAQLDRLSDLEIDVEDCAEILLRFRSGAMGSIHLDMVQRPPTRSCRIVGSEGTLVWDWGERRARCFSAGRGTWEELEGAEAADGNGMYLEEVRHFLACVADGTPVLVTGEDGRRVLEIALAAKESARTGTRVAV